jgi:ADP-heptose:LPS heptosyltransferase
MESQLKIDTPINVLVQRRGAIGDVIMSTGVVRELKSKYGEDANIDIATDCAEVYRNNPRIRNVFPVDQIPSGTNWDVYINLDDAYESNPLNNYVESYFYRAFGNRYHNLNLATELFPTTEDLEKVANFRATNELTEKYIVVHMRNWHWAAKNISMDVWLESFLKVFETTSDFKIVCVGAQTDHFVDHPLFVDARSVFNVQQLSELCDKAKCFVGVDSAPYHCAAASNTHIIALLTHLLPERILPNRKRVYANNCTAIQTLEDCAGCNDRQAIPIRQIICEKSNYPCVKNFDTTVIANAILETLK